MGARPIRRLGHRRRTRERGRRQQQQADDGADGDVERRTPVNRVSEHCRRSRQSAALKRNRYTTASGRAIVPACYRQVKVMRCSNAALAETVTLVAVCVSACPDNNF